MIFISFISVLAFLFFAFLLLGLVLCLTILPGCARYQSCVARYQSVFTQSCVVFDYTYYRAVDRSLVCVWFRWFLSVCLLIYLDFQALWSNHKLQPCGDELNIWTLNRMRCSLQVGLRSSRFDFVHHAFDFVRHVLFYIECHRHFAAYTILKLRYM